MVGSPEVLQDSMLLHARKGVWPEPSLLGLPESFARLAREENNLSESHGANRRSLSGDVGYHVVGGTEAREGDCMTE